MTTPMIWYFIKFFAQEEHADAFMKGSLYLNTLAYFKKLESECDDGRMDATEAVAMWWQPHDFIMNLNVPGIGATEITSKDLAGPVSAAFEYHDYLHLHCLYAVHTTGFECVDGKIYYAPEDAEELRRQLTIDERCLKFGRFAVITPAVPFIDRLREALKSQGYKAKLVDYYDDEVFHGEIPMAEIPFKKQKRFSYQREFRLCVYPRTQQDTAITIAIGDISSICAKVEAARLNGLLGIQSEPAPEAQL
jgi:hypothetical protein